MHGYYMDIIDSILCAAEYYTIKGSCCYMGISPNKNKNACAQ